MRNKHLFVSVTLWAAVLVMLAMSAAFFLPYQPSFPYAKIYLTSSGLPPWIYSWANFDGVHYLTIIKNGYVGTGLIQAFFPVYPYLIAGISAIGLHPIVVGQGISLLAIGSALFIWDRLINSLYSQKISRISRVLLLLFPTSFFFMGVYTESLFLLCTVISLYAAHTKRWRVAILAAAIASGTRVVGVLLVPALMIEYLEQAQILSYSALLKPLATLKKINFTNFTKLITFILGGAGLGTYMLYLWRTFGDPLYFFHVQSEFGTGRSESLVSLPQVLYRGARIVLTVPMTNWNAAVYIQELVLSLLFIVVVFSTFKKQRMSHVFLSTFLFLFPTLTGTLSSMPRYLLVCISFFIGGAVLLESRPKLRFAWYTVSSILLVVNTIHFIQGYWIA